MPAPRSTILPAVRPPRLDPLGWFTHFERLTGAEIGRQIRGPMARVLAGHADLYDRHAVDMAAAVLLLREAIR